MFFEKVALKEELFKLKEIADAKKKKKAGAVEKLNSTKVKGNPKQISKAEEELQQATAQSDSADLAKANKVKEYFSFRSTNRKDFGLKINELTGKFLQVYQGSLEELGNLGQEILDVSNEFDAITELEDPEVPKLEEALAQLNQVVIE
jgi:hypothetical protein